MRRALERRADGQPPGDREQAPGSTLPEKRAEDILPRRLQSVLGVGAVPWPLVGLSLVYFGYLAIRFERIVAGINWVSDAVWAKVLAERAQPGGGLTLVGAAPHYSTVAFLWSTRWIPFRRIVWDVAPVLIAVAGAALVGWTVWRLAGRWAGILSFCLIATASPTVLQTTLPQGMRSHTWLGMVAIAALLLLLVERAIGPSSSSLAFPMLGAALIGGVALGSDPLFFGCAMVPFAVAGITPWVVEHSKEHFRLAQAVAVASAGALAVGALVSTAGRVLGFRKTHPIGGFEFATVPEMAGSIRLVGENVLVLFNAYFPGRPLGVRSLLELVVGAGSFVAVALPIVLLLRRLRSPRDVPLSEVPTLTHLAFWSMAVATTTVLFVLSNVTVGSGVFAARYLVPLFFAVGATVPLWAAEREGRRLVVLGGACAVCLLNVVAVRGSGSYELFGLYNHESAPLVKTAPAMFEFLEEEGLRYGYSSYWHSHPLTYQSNHRVVVTPVTRCPQDSTALCRFWVNTRSSWYQPKEGRSFLIVDSGNATAPEVLVIRDPVGDLGEPVKKQIVGEYSIYVYDYDIAEKLRPYPIPG